MTRLTPIRSSSCVASVGTAVTTAIDKDLKLFDSAQATTADCISINQ